MKSFIGTIPFFDSEMIVHAYRMKIQDGSKLLGTAEDFRQLGSDLMAPALEFVQKFTTEPFAGGNDFFVDISKYQLLMTMPLQMKIPPEKLVCVVHKDILTDKATHAKLMLLKRKGYRLALEGYPRAISMETALSVFEFFLLNCSSSDFSEDFNDIRQHIFKTRLAITDIPDVDTFNKYSGVRSVLLSGNFYSQPLKKGVSDISPLKINALSLLRQINDESFELGEAAEIIERDPALTISLLRFINAMNPDRSRKIASIRNAVAILGQKEVKRWATVAISISIGADRPNELTRLSLIRAKFAENLAPAFDMAMKSGTLFISGLFSLLNIILQSPIEEAIEKVAADAEIKDALVHKKGIISEVLALIFAYDKADWHNTSIIMVKNDVDVEVLTKAYLDSITWYKQLLDSIDEEEELAMADENETVEDDV